MQSATFNNPPWDRHIRLPEVKLLTGLSKRSIYRRIQEGKLPEAGKDGRISYWWLSQIHKYLGIQNGEQ